MSRYFGNIINEAMLLFPETAAFKRARGWMRERERRWENKESEQENPNLLSCFMEVEKK